jgi:NAD(P)-dependent dehydrogenase (short-subunit alcohol dehydrogenase family)
MNVLVLGGYGNFGARICRALATDPLVSLQICGRDRDKAQALAVELGAEAVRVDTSMADLPQQLQRCDAQLVIHTAGPFQAQDYTVARAAAQVGAHYIDLADGRRFVCDFAKELDALFRKAGRCAVAGASTVPALSSAVVNQFGPRFERLDSIDICIAPAQRAPRGRATLAGVLSYCGEPVQVWRDGRWLSQYGWAGLTTVRFARMRPRQGALCDIPDLELFPAHYQMVKSVMFRAALEVPVTQRVFATLSWLRRHRWIGSPVALAGVLHRTGGIFDPLGSPQGAMVVRLAGQGRDGRRLQLAWHLTAGEHHGPEIPCMAAILLARRLARNDNPPNGACTSLGLLNLQEFAPEFDRWGMITEWHEETDDGA